MSRDRTPIRALLFDVDGTLYHQGPVRRRMAQALLARFLVEPRRARERLRNLSCWRAALEAVRTETFDFIKERGGLRARQRAIALQNGARPETLDADVREWMEERALPVLATCKRPGLDAFLDEVRDLGVRIGAWSDYPCTAKLASLGLEDRFEVQVAADDTAVDCLKPWPHGFRVAAQRFDLPTKAVFYIGDRADVDATGAGAAGMRSAIFTKARGGGYLAVRDVAELRAALLPLLSTR